MVSSLSSRAAALPLTVSVLIGGWGILTIVSWCLYRGLVISVAILIACTILRLRTGYWISSVWGWGRFGSWLIYGYRWDWVRAVFI